MQLIQQPNDWTCGPCALAMAIGVGLGDVLAAAGHDGTVNGRPVGFNEADLTMAALRLGYATVRLPAAPVHESTVVLIPGWPAIGRLLAEVDEPKVLVVNSGGRMHAVAAGVCKPGAVYFDPARETPQPIERIPPIRFVDFFWRLPRPWRLWPERSPWDGTV